MRENKTDKFCFIVNSGTFMLGKINNYRSIISIFNFKHSMFTWIILFVNQECEGFHVVIVTTTRTHCDVM